MTTKGKVKVFWYTALLRDKMAKFNNRDIVIWNATEQTANMINVTVPQYYNVVSTTTNKRTQYKYLKIDILKF